MRDTRARAVKLIDPVQLVCDRRTDPRMPVDFGLMYSTLDDHGNLIMGDGTVVDLSSKGLGIRGNIPASPNSEMTLLLYLPDGQDPLIVMEARVAWSKGHRFGLEILKMNLRERNRLRYFLYSNFPQE